MWNRDLVFGPRREDLPHGRVKLLDHVQALHVAFRQLGIAHQFGDDLVGPLHLLANDLDLFIHRRVPFLQRAVKTEGGIVDDSQRVLDLMSDLGRQPSCGAQTFLPDGEFRRLGFGPLLFFEEHLDAVTA